MVADVKFEKLVRITETCLSLVGNVLYNAFVHSFLETLDLSNKTKHFHTLKYEAYKQV